MSVGERWKRKCSKRGQDGERGGRSDDRWVVRGCVFDGVCVRKSRVGSQGVFLRRAVIALVDLNLGVWLVRDFAPLELLCFEAWWSSVSVDAEGLDPRTGLSATTCCDGTTGVFMYQSDPGGFLAITGAAKLAPSYIGSLLVG